MYKTVPTLTTDGFVTHPPHMLIKIFEYFLSSDYSQTVTFYGSIASFRYIVRKHSDNLDNLRYELNTKLQTTLSRFWNNVTVETELTEIPNSVFMSVIFNIEVIVDGQKYILEREIRLNNTTFLNKDVLIEYLETGVYNG